MNIPKPASQFQSPAVVAASRQSAALFGLEIKNGGALPRRRHGILKEPLAFGLTLLAATLALPCLLNAAPLESEFRSPPDEYRPETWFHINGNNLTKEGITKDLEAIKYAGIRGIQLFSKSGEVYPNVPQVEVLSPEWRGIIGHLANECQRLGLSLTMQNCPGWSQSGGPWVPVEEAQRELVTSVTRVQGGKPFDGRVPVDAEFSGKDFNYQDICVLAFPTPDGAERDVLIPDHIESNTPGVPWKNIFDPAKCVRIPPKGSGPAKNKNKDCVVQDVGGKDAFVLVRFDQPVTIRSLQLPPVDVMIDAGGSPKTDLKFFIEKAEGGKFTPVATVQVPNTCWMDRQLSCTLAIPETTTRELRITFQGGDSRFLNFLFLQGQAKLHNWEAKAGFVLRDLQWDHNPDYAKSCYINSEKLVDLTGKLDATGRLDWTPPPGAWTIVRFGHVNMRQVNGPTTKEAQGWECSKLDKIALENHLRKGMIGSLMGPGAPIGDGKLTGLLIDSWERGVQTWTIHSETLFAEFKQRRGYDLHPYLPAMMGYVVNDPARTEKFLCDLRETMDALYFENYFAEFTRIAHEWGVIVYTEGASGEVLPGDALRYYSMADVPMTEFWYRNAPSGHGIDSKPPYYATSAGHLYGKKKIGAEALTEGGATWREHPAVGKALIDEHYTYGINHLIFHTFSHTPQSVVYPGSTFGGTTGFPFVRNQTWWRHMPAFVDYLTRCQYVLQQGECVADVLWYLGDELERPPLPSSPFPAGYRYDLLNPDVLHTRLSVVDGRLHVKDGTDYRVIQLRNSSRMLRSTAERLKELVLAGAVILGDKPQDSPSLTDDAADVAALKKIADELWGGGASGVKQAGKGKVYWGQSLEAVLRAEAIAPDVTTADHSGIRWIHRRAGDTDLYFLCSQNQDALDATVSFHATGKAPELWDAFTGNTQSLGVWQEKAGRIQVPLRFAPNGSAIVVLRPGKPAASWAKVARDGETVLDSQAGWMQKPKTDAAICEVASGTLTAWAPGQYELTDPAGQTKRINAKSGLQPVDGPWSVAFEAGWDAPAMIELPKLSSLTEHTDPAVRYYSGTATYRKDFQLAEVGSNVMLDLGAVENIAEVWCNGKKVGTRWAPPFRFDLAKTVQRGGNELVVKVTNPWRNQLIYDLTRPEGRKKTWTTNPPRNPKEAPSPSGLIGPVVLRTTSTERLQ